MSAVPDKECLPPEVIEWLQWKYPPVVGVYPVTTLVGCLADAYDSYTARKAEPFREMWRRKRGTLIHSGLNGVFSWCELKTSHTFEFEGETIRVTAKLDAYSSERQTLYDFKTTDELAWQLEKWYLPRRTDVVQIQSYWTMFKPYIPIKELKLIYIDKSSCEAYSVPQKDTLDWLVLRAKTLHKALKSKIRPPSDPGCWVCSKSPQNGGSP